MEKQINLEAIFNNKNPQDGSLPQWAKEFTMEVCRQVLELAAENAKVNLKPINLYDSVWFVNKESILNTINQVI